MESTEQKTFGPVVSVVETERSHRGLNVFPGGKQNRNFILMSSTDIFSVRLCGSLARRSGDGSVALCDPSYLLSLFQFGYSFETTRALP